MTSTSSRHWRMMLCCSASTSLMVLLWPTRPTRRLAMKARPEQPRSTIPTPRTWAELALARLKEHDFMLARGVVPYRAGTHGGCIPPQYASKMHDMKPQSSREIPYEMWIIIRWEQVLTVPKRPPEARSRRRMDRVMIPLCTIPP